MKAILNTLAKQIRGVSYKPENVLSSSTGNGVPLLRANNIRNNLVNFDELVFIDKKCVKEDQYLQKGDILVCTSSGSRMLVGKSAYIDKNYPYVFGAFCRVIRPQHVNHKFLAYYFQSPSYYHQISQFIAGANINNIRSSDIDQMIIDVPDISQQEKIVVKFDKIFKLISLRHKQLMLYDELIKSRFIELFGNAKSIEYKSLKEVCEFIDYRGKTPEKSGQGIPLITAKNVKENRFSIEPREFVPAENYESIMTRGIPKPNDVLFTTEAPLGNVCRIPNIFDKFCVGQRIITLQPHKDILTSEYLEQALLAPEFQAKLLQKSSGSTVTGIRSKLLERLTIPIIPLHMQVEFVGFLQQIDKSRLAGEFCEFLMLSCFKMI